MTFIIVPTVTSAILQIILIIIDFFFMPLALVVLYDTMQLTIFIYVFFPGCYDGKKEKKIPQIVLNHSTIAMQQTFAFWFH